MLFPSKPWVLVLDDDPEILSIFTQLLEAAGCRVVACQKIPEARGKILNQKFACMVLDWVVEHGNSEQLIAFIRDPKGFNHTTPIVLISGQLEPDVIKRMARSVDGILVKPFKNEVLLEKVASLVGE